MIVDLNVIVGKECRNVPFTHYRRAIDQSAGLDQHIVN